MRKRMYWFAVTAAAAAVRARNADAAQNNLSNLKGKTVPEVDAPARRLKVVVITQVSDEDLSRSMKCGSEMTLP